jgi:hypothetical protein
VVAQPGDELSVVAFATSGVDIDNGDLAHNGEAIEGDLWISSVDDLSLTADQLHGIAGNDVYRGD